MYINDYIVACLYYNYNIMYILTFYIFARLYYINYDNCIGKSRSKFLRLQLLFLSKNRFEVNKKPIFSSEKMQNSGNCINDYAHSFFGVVFKSNALYWYLLGLNDV